MSVLGHKLTVSFRSAWNYRGDLRLVWATEEDLVSKKQNSSCCSSSPQIISLKMWVFESENFEEKWRWYITSDISLDVQQIPLDGHWERVVLWTWEWLNKICYKRRGQEEMPWLGTDPVCWEKDLYSGRHWQMLEPIFPTDVWSCPIALYTWHVWNCWRTNLINLKIYTLSFWAIFTIFKKLYKK